MSDPLDYMNQLCRWDQSFPWSEQWAKAMGKACEIIVERDARIAELTERCERAERERDTWKARAEEIARVCGCLDPDEHGRASCEPSCAACLCFEPATTPAASSGEE